MVTFCGQYAAVTTPEALDMNVLGRDITGRFAVIVDPPGNIVCLLGQRHQYSIMQRWGHHGQSPDQSTDAL